MTKLILSGHARCRAHLRGITADEINDALQSGRREPRGDCVLHYDLRSHVAVVVNWRVMVIVTVFYLAREHYGKLREQVLQK